LDVVVDEAVVVSVGVVDTEVVNVELGVEYVVVTDVVEEEL
jgi:hypothetical protein